MSLKDSISHLIVVGANHRSSSSKFREKLILCKSDLRALLKKAESSKIKHYFLIYGDNRVEFIFSHNSPSYVVNLVLSSLADVVGLSRKEVEKNLFVLKNRHALRHIFNLVSTVDSLVPGNLQFFLSIKKTFLQAKKSYLSDSSFSDIVEQAIATTEKIESKTKLFSIPMSIARAAEQIAKEIHGDLSRCVSLFIGPGKVVEMFVKYFQDSGLGKIILTSASAEWMEKVSLDISSQKVSLDSLEQILGKVDILVTAAGHGRIITEKIIKLALSGRKARPLFIIDGSIPGDVEVEVAGLDDVFLYDLNDLEQVIIDSRVESDIAIREAKKLIGKQTSLILHSLNKKDVSSSNQVSYDDSDLEASKRDVLRRNKTNAKPVAIIKALIRELKERKLLRKGKGK